jgi:glycyl-tRNA synthetase beta chain
MDTTKMKNAPLLIEMLVEELPPKALAKLGQSFAQTMREVLALELIETSCVEESFATPRRLAVLFHDVSAQAPSREVRQKLMPVKVGLDASDRRQLRLKNSHPWDLVI